MIVSDGFLECDVFLSIKKSIDDSSFPWEKCMILKDPPVHLNPVDNIQYVHGFYLENARARFVSRHFDLVLPLIEKLAPTGLIKVKINRTTKKDRHIEFGMHLDTKRPGAATAIFYLNTNNGYTLFADGQKVDSVANRMVIFDSSKPHTGVSCTDTDYRLVINFNMFLEKEARLAACRT